MNALGAASPQAAGTAAATTVAPAGARAGAPDKARQVAQDFESFFLSQVLQAMSAGIRTDGPFGGGQGEAVFRGLLNEEFAKQMAGAGGLGIADAVYREMLRLQEVGAS